MIAKFMRVFEKHNNPQKLAINSHLNSNAVGRDSRIFFSLRNFLENILQLIRFKILRSFVKMIHRKNYEKIRKLSFIFKVASLTM